MGEKFEEDTVLLTALLDGTDPRLNDGCSKCNEAMCQQVCSFVTQLNEEVIAEVEEEPAEPELVESVKSEEVVEEAENSLSEADKFDSESVEEKPEEA